MTDENKQEESRYYGKYRALVTNNQDPKKQLRVKCNIPSLLGGYESGWAMPCVPLLGNTEGLFKLPQVGDGLWIEFESGDLNYPIYVGGWSNPSKVPVDTYAHADKIMQIQTRGGHKVQIDDVNDMIVIETSTKGRSSGTRVEIDNESNVRVIGSLTVTGNVRVQGNTRIDGTTTSQGKLTVNSSASISGNTAIGGTTTSKGQLTVHSDAQIDGDTMIAQQLDVGQQLIAVGSITTEKNLFVSGGAKVSGAVNVYGKTTLSDNLTVNADDVEINANVKVIGDTEVEGALKHKGDIDFKSIGDIILEGNVETTGDLRAEGIVRSGDLGFVTDGTLFVVGDATIGGNLSGSTARFSGNVEAPNIP